jgi:hypothetical protein
MTPVLLPLLLLFPAFVFGTCTTVGTPLIEVVVNSAVSDVVSLVLEGLLGSPFTLEVVPGEEGFGSGVAGVFGA